MRLPLNSVDDVKTVSSLFCNHQKHLRKVTKTKLSGKRSNVSARVFKRLPLVDECHNYKHQTVCDERIKPPHLFTEQEKIADRNLSRKT
jgi:hypothetical protein